MKNFVERWIGRGDEKSDTQTFWIDLLTNVFGVKNISQFIFFEERVQLEHKSFIDATIPSTHVMIEQKSLGKDLSKPIKQSDGTFLTPYQQAKRYANELPYSKRPRWIIACNFAEFQIYDMENPHDEPTKILLEELPEKFHSLDFLIDPIKNKIYLEEELSVKAGKIVEKLYDALRSQYVNPNDEKSLQSLNKLCVRLVFCLFAESSGVFGKHKIFRDYLQNSRNIRRDLLDLFEVLNTEKNLRDPYLDENLKNFPYVNGGLFAEKNIEIPNFTDEIKNLLLEEASSSFDWSGISPTIFGAVFESTLNPEKILPGQKNIRREGGMHYTSIENIHKVIDPLFLDDLNEEFEKIKNSPRNKKKNLLDFQQKLSELKFLDPACGSGNFLTETYISLRRLENKILKELLGEKILLGDFDNPIKVSINQFYGIEINDFAVSVAQTALWISELQMAQETSELIHRDIDFLPLKNFANIFECNALQVDWQKICPNPNYIMGNPPFVGRRYQSPEQKKEIAEFFTYKDVDYVACWFKKAAEFLFYNNSPENNFRFTKIPDERLLAVQKVFSPTFSRTKSPQIECAFVSTNSIVQGEQVAAVWENLGVEINFCHRTFVWDSESTDKAHVHCVIIGFANFSRAQKIIFDGDKKIFAKNINAYLQDAPNIFIKPRNKTLQKNSPQMFFGNMAADNKNFSLTEDEKNILLKKFPDAQKFIKNLVGGEEFLHNKKRFCLWLVGANPSEIKKIPPIYERIKKVREFRLNSSFKKIADRPHEFRDLKNPKKFIVIPQVSSERRKYIPIGFLDENFIATTQLQIIPDAELFHFGVLTSSVHNIWTKNFCGRLKSDLRYSKEIIYNNFVWCDCSEIQRKKIEQTAQNILDCRKNYPDASLADLYDENLMPVDLRKAHEENDKAVMAAYGFDKNFSELQIVGELMKLYQELTK